MGLQGKRLLLIEDDPDIQGFVATVARMEGIDLWTAATVADGLALFREEGPFDLLLLDLGLPDGSGWDVLQQVRAFNPYRHLTVAIFTASVDLPTTQRARALGADDVICKPVTALELVERLRRLLE